MQRAILEEQYDIGILEEDLDEALKMPLADAIIHKEKMPNDGIRRFKFYDERAFVKFVHTLRKVSGFRVVIPGGSNYYIVHGEDDYGDVIIMFRGARNHQSMFIELAFKKLGIPVKSYTGDYLLDLLKL